jgi:thiaminase/transcriptional activator TenA
MSASPVPDDELPATSGGELGFDAVLWNATADLRRAIDDLEFLRQLGDGTLPLPAFRAYLEQDAIYLAGYSRALALLAATAPDPLAAAFWATSAATATTVEAGLHQELLQGDRLGAPADMAAGSDGVVRDLRSPAEPTPMCLGYVSYLIATAATAPYPVAAAAVLPCYWIYADVSARLAEQAEQVLAADPSHPFARWVAAYDGPEFQQSVLRARALVASAGAAASPDQRSAMLTAFRTATRFEHQFWDTALNPRPWPV